MTPATGPTPDPRSGRPFWHRPRPVLAVVTLTVVAAALVVPAGACMWGPSTPVLIRSATPYGEPSCGVLVSNESLNQTYVSVYEGLPNLTRNWTPGPNESAPTPQSAYPAPNEGAAQLVRAWTAICGSAAFQQTYAEAGPAEFGQGYGLNSTTGDYQAFFTLTTTAACPSDLGGTGTLCATRVAWYVDLVSGQIVGPVTGAPYLPTGFAPGPPANSGSSTAPSSVSGATVLSPVLLGGIAAFVIGAIALVAVVRRRQRPPEGAVTVRAGAPERRTAPRGTPGSPGARPGSGEKPPTPTSPDDPLADVY